MGYLYFDLMRIISQLSVGRCFPISVNTKQHMLRSVIPPTVTHCAGSWPIQPSRYDSQ